jgi:2-polyprenyl-3-methyl-5-hydroxy-6-metoxy-1,4-benzoquinol methylase
MVRVARQRVIREDVILAAASGNDVLDIGCVAADGLMRLHRDIRAVARSCVGLDQVAADGVISGDAQAFALGRRFDVIIAGEVIEHLGDVRGFLDSTAEALLPRGRLIVTTPNAFSGIMLRRAVIGRIVPNDPYHVAMFDMTTIVNMFNNYGAGRFEGYACYYEERHAALVSYRANRLLSRLLPGFSSGILLDLRRV